MKKLFVIIMLIAMSMSVFAGCSSGENVQQQPEKEQVKNNDTKQTDSSVEDDTNKEFTLKISLQDAKSDGFDIAAEMFKKKYPNAKIEFLSSPWGNGGQDLRYRQLVLISSGEEPDIGKMVWGKEFFSNGIIEDITDEVKTWDIYEQLSDGQLQRMTYEDKIYGVTYNNNCVYQFVNMDILKQAGINEVPKTMEDLTNLAKAIKEKDLRTKDGKSIYTVSFEGGNWTTDWWLWANGGKQMTEDYTKALIDSEESLKAFELMQSFVKNGWAPKMDGSYDQLWLNGQIAVWTCGDWNIEPTKNAGINVKYAPPPIGISGNATSIGGVEWAVFKSSKYKKEALEFLKILYTEEFQTTFDNGITNLQMYDHPKNIEKWGENGKLEAKKVQQLQLTSTNYNFLESPFIFPETSKIYNDALARILIGLEDVKTVMTEAANKINKGIEEELQFK